MNLQQIKQLFYTYRNGVTAQTLRQAAWPHSVIYGLNVPQLAEIASAIGRNEQLGKSLWNDSNVRESRLLAAYILPTDMPQDTINDICNSLLTREEADMLAFRWLRYSQHAPSLTNQWSKSQNPLLQYLATAVERFLH